MPKSYIRIFISLIGALKVCFGAKRNHCYEMSKNVKKCQSFCIGRTAFNFIIHL